ncbi:AraC family transcriptional regulator [Lederbergia panacisoli]|uniref:AraC family transcriptional regulator n=1 Tax=Lederbergia panacisoli TaxID=1255251 RepID=UPI00214CDA76|nr:AraC family transcriptional regulator [Lederbergia panacisoli]MCR2821536.1 AraC family transcriptional regulator [Lederbergia panacisoli]
MAQIIINVQNNFLNKDLLLYNYGMQHLYPNHSYSSKLRDYYLINYVLDGEGILEIGNISFTIKKGQGFLIDPNIFAHYKADYSKSLKYCWVGFNGILAEHILNETSVSAKSPIFIYDPEEMHFQQLLSTISNHSTTNKSELRIHGLLYLLLSALVEKYPKQKIIKKQIKKEEYVNKVITFIEKNYKNKITVAMIAEYIGLDRSYLSSLFNEYLKFSIQEYLIHFRMNKACSFLHNSELSIGDIAKSVGYEDPLLFSKMFKKYKGISPKHYRIAAYNHIAENI